MVPFYPFDGPFLSLRKIQVGSPSEAGAIRRRMEIATSLIAKSWAIAGDGGTSGEGVEQVAILMPEEQVICEWRRFYLVTH